MNFHLNTEIDNVKTEYNSWRQIEKSQKEKLYDLLAKNLRIIENINAATDYAKIEERLKKAKIKVNKKSSIELKVIRLIMTSERKKASTYAIVLKAARKANIKSDEFVKWLKAEGGIEAVRKKNSDTPNLLERERQFSVGKTVALSQAPLATVTLNIPQTQKNDLVLLVARVGDNNQVEVVDIAATDKNDSSIAKSVRAISKKAGGSQEGNVQGKQSSQSALNAIIKSTATSISNGGNANA